MDNAVLTHFKKLITESNIKSTDIEIPAVSALESFLLNRENGSFLLSLGLTSLSVLKAKRTYEQNKDKGVHSLYMGYFYLNLHLHDEIFLYEPLILFPVNISAKNSTWYITNNKDMNIMLNYKLIYYYFQVNGLNYNFFQKEFKNFNFLGENKIAGLLMYLQENSFSIDNNHITYSDKAFNLCFISPSFSMFRDYENILLNNSDNCHLDILLKSSEDSSLLNEDRNPVSDLFLITPLNSNQINAVIKTANLNQIVITGAKGNGKKETILNIISHSLSKGENILVVSEDKNTLINIYERLSKISDKICMLTDDPYNIIEMINFLLNIKIEKQNVKILPQIKSKTDYLNRKFKAIADMEQVLYKKRPFGLSLQEMYSKAEMIKSKDDYRYEAFKIFQFRNLFKEFTYGQLKESIAGLGEGEICCYEEYRNLIEDYPFLLKINSNADPSIIDDIYKNNEDIKSAFINIYKNIKELENFSDMAVLNFQNNFKVLNHDILYTAKKILNISADNSQSKNRLIRFIKYRSKLSEDAFKIKIEEKSETLTVYNSMLINYMETISPLKEVLNQDFYIKLTEDALKGLDVSDQFNALFKAVSKFNLYKKYVNTLNRFNDLEKLMLCYIYENNQPPFDKLTLLNHILEFSILSQIKDIEKQSSEKKSLFTYLKCGELKDSITSLWEEMNCLSFDYINQLWVNKLIDMKDSKNFKNLMQDLNSGLSLRSLFNKHSKLILTLFPVVMAVPENVSDILPLKDNFSQVIFADSSLISIERAVPSLYRGRRLTISGDMLSVIREDSLIYNFKDKCCNIFLNYNYIEERQEITGFINQNFYENSIVISPDIRKRSRSNPAIEFLDFENALNILSQNILDGNLNKIGINVFCERDKKNINSELVKREIYLNKDHIFTPGRFFYADYDTVFIFTSGFSEINNKFKYNILNIAISSARKKIYLICEGDNDEILREYIKYRDNINQSKHRETLSKNKEWLINELITLGCKLSFNLGHPPGIDIGIYNKSGRYILGIIFDNEILYPLSLIRFYEEHGWKIYPVWSRDLCQDKISVLNNITKTIGLLRK